MKNWYSIKSKSRGVLDISIHDEIGLWGVSAAEFIAELRESSDISVINLSIHSPGGSMIDGFAMYNALKLHPAKVYGHIEGLAASMAGVVLMAADVRTMPVNAFFMAHAPSGGAYGESSALREMADLMDKFRDSAFSIFRGALSLPDEEINAFLDSETWFNGEEALAAGIVHTLTDEVSVAACGGFDKHFKSMPVNADQTVESIETVRDFERYLRDSGGLSKRVANALSSRAKALFQSDSGADDGATISDLSAALARIKVPVSL